MQNEYIIKREVYKVRTKELKTRNERGVTLIALVVTIIFSYDEILKFSNNKGFLLQAIY